MLCDLSSGYRYRRACRCVNSELYEVYVGPRQFKGSFTTMRVENPSG